MVKVTTGPRSVCLVTPFNALSASACRTLDSLHKAHVEQHLGLVAGSMIYTMPLKV